VAQFELPGSPLVALAPAVLSDSQEPELIVATGNDGILAFNSRFSPDLPADSEARAITAILPVPPTTGSTASPLTPLDGSGR